MTDIMDGETGDAGRPDPQDELLVHTADIVAAFVGQSKASPDQLPEIIRTVHQALAGIAAGGGPAAPQERQKPAAPINKSVHHDYIICLEDGAQLKMLKRYLRSRYDMSPDEYRRKWGLPPDYPMVAPAYAARRSEFARSIGLGKGVRRKA